MSKITVVGLGPGAAKHIALETLEAMRGADEVLLRTSVHPSVSVLREYGIEYTALDSCYDNDDFDKVYDAIVSILLARAQDKNIVYAVPGSPQVAEKTVTLLRQRAGAQHVDLEVLPALSFLDVFFSRLALDPVEGLAIVDGLCPDKLMAAGDLPLLVTQVYDRRVASEIKLTLMEKYPDEHKVVFLRNLGMPEEEVREICLFELDRQEEIDHLTSLFVPVRIGAMDVTPLVDTLARLRAPGGCPWDREQTAGSLREYLVEEVYEVIDAIDKGDMRELCDELGDLLLQIVFHARIAEEQDAFKMQDVVDNVVQKMYRRHPHVFGTIQVSGSDEVIKNWEAIKKLEYQDRGKILDGVPKALPALAAACKLQGKAGKAGFDWPDVSGVWDKLDEEVGELREAVALGDCKAMEHELGDVLLVLANLARHIKCHPEVALNGANNRFRERFSHVEACVNKSGRQWQEFSLSELDEFWCEAKKM